MESNLRRQHFFETFQQSNLQFWNILGEKHSNQDVPKCFACHSSSWKLQWKINQIIALPLRIVGYCWFIQLKSCNMKSNSIPACSGAKATNVPQSARSCEKLTRPCNPFCQRDSLNPWQKVVTPLFLNTWTSWNWVKSQETTFLRNMSALSSQTHNSEIYWVKNILTRMSPNVLHAVQAPENFNEKLNKSKLYLLGL